MTTKEDGMTTNEKSLAILDPQQGLVVAPAYEKATDVIARATEWANALMDVVEKQKLYAIINGKKHLEAEAWELIMAFDQAAPVVDWVEKMLDQGGETMGYLAKVSIVKGEGLKASAIMPCGFDDFPCRGKQGTAQVKAAMSAAQTWAMAKACRLCYSPVAVLAGYSPTPAEEMLHGSAPPVPQPNAPAKTPSRAAQPPSRPAAPAGPPTATRPATVKLGVCEEHGRSWGRMPDGSVRHPMDAGQPWHIQDATPQGSGSAPANPEPAEGQPEIFPDTPLGALQRDVAAQQIGWADFENEVLKNTWADWVKLGGTIDTARRRWTWYKEELAKKEATP